MITVLLLVPANGPPPASVPSSGAGAVTGVALQMMQASTMVRKAQRERQEKARRQVSRLARTGYYR